MSDDRLVQDTEGVGVGPPRVFVSYTHENRDHKRWVLQLATDLCNGGVDVVLDQWDLGLGKDVTLFMETGIRSADRVLLVCTPAYARKANEGQGGVGYERLVVTGEIAEEIDTNKFICVLRSGTKEDALPAFAQTRLYVDFTDAATYDVSLEELLRDIHQAPALPKPPVGANPFTGGTDSATVAGRPTRPQTPVDATVDIEGLYARGTRLLRDKDLLGWKQLVRNVQSSVPDKLALWRENAQQRPREEMGKLESWLPVVHDACVEIGPLIVLALTAVDSEIDGLSDQRFPRRSPESAELESKRPERCRQDARRVGLRLPRCSRILPDRFAPT